MAETPNSKVCTHCNQCKPRSQFYCDKRASHGMTTQCKQCMNERKKAKRAIDPEATRAAWRDDYRRHKGRYQRAAKKYQERNAERFAAWTCHSDAIRRCKVPTTLTAAEFAAWRVGADKVCHWCGVECADNFHTDHVIPLSRGGAHHLSNVVIACPQCNLSKHTKMPDDWGGA